MAVAPNLEARGITKSFGGVPVLRAVNFDCRPGEVHALVGENGAGKSTLSHILSGVLRPDSGEVSVNGRPVRLDSPAHARTLGINVVLQEFGLVPSLSIAENLFLGRERVRGPWLDHRQMETEARAVLTRIGRTDLDPRLPVEVLSVADQQLVEIGRSLAFSARTIIMDEPTAALAQGDADRLLAVVERLKSSGVGVVYVSHRLDEILKVADRITVMKDGAVTYSGDTAHLSKEHLVSLMVGREIGAIFPAKRAPLREEVVLAARGIACEPALQPLDLELHAGEILGVAGLAGAGRTTLARSLFGVAPGARGEFWVAGRPVTIRSPQDAIAAGIGFVTENRSVDGLALLLDVAANAVAASLLKLSRWGLVSRTAEEHRSAEVLGPLHLRAASFNQAVGTLSGGNQQKVVLAKWLMRNPRVLILDEPTRGVDVATKQEIYRLLMEQKARGQALLLISSEMTELIGLSDRVLVLHQGRATALLSGDQMTETAIMRAAAGLTD